MGRYTPVALRPWLSAATSPPGPGSRRASRLAAIALVISMAAIAGCGAAGGKTSAACPGSRSLPQRYTEAGDLSTRLQFVQTGCSVAIASIEVYAQAHLVRKAVFNPPLPAGSLTAKTATQWSSNGSFRATTQLAGLSGAVSRTQEGTYRATATVLVAEPVGGPSRQWATGATASTQLSDKWSADHATGPPAKKAWVPSTKDGTSEWLDLTYAQSVVPTAVNIWESNGPGFVTKVEAFDQGKKAWVKLWEGTDPTLGAPKVFSPALTKTSLSTSRIRLTVNTNVPDWNEIAAVALVGPPQAAGQVVWLQGEWVESGKETVCLGKKCTTAPITDPPSLEWSFAFNTVTGKVGTTPDQVS